MCSVILKKLIPDSAPPPPAVISDSIDTPPTQEQTKPPATEPEKPAGKKTKPRSAAIERILAMSKRKRKNNEINNECDSYGFSSRLNTFGLNFLVFFGESIFLGK